MARRVYRQRVVADHERLLGAGRPDTLTVRNFLAVARRQLPEDDGAAD